MFMTVDGNFLTHFKNLKQVFLYLTEDCNLKCVQCLYKPSLVTKKSITPDIAKSLLKACKDLGAFKLTILGGEATLYDTDSLCSIISFAKEIGYRYIRIDTNGLFHKSLFASELFSKIDEVSFSIDGFDNETNGSLRGQGSFVKALANLRLSIQKNIKAHITSCATKQNCKIAGGVKQYLLSMIKFAEKENVSTINFHGVFKLGTPMDAWTDDSHLETEEWYFAVKDIRELMFSNSFSISVRLPLHIVTKAEFDSNPTYYGYCPSKLGERILIHPSGLMQICSSLLSSCYGCSYFTNEKIIWNESATNELNELGMKSLTPCSHQKALYNGDYVPVCFSLKPYQKEIVWNQLKHDNVIKEL